jgi:multidrug efflux pump subunit AcrB
MMLSSLYANSRFLILTVGLITVAGVASFLVLPRMEDPLLTPRAATLTTIFPGADAERVEALVTEKIENELKEIEEIKEVRSTSRTGVSFIAIELIDEVNAVEASNVWSRIRDKAADAALLLPPGVMNPEFSRLDVKANSLIVGLRWDQPSEPNYAILYRLIKQLKDQIDEVSGTEKSEIYGTPQEEILVTVRPESAVSMNLNAGELAQKISASDSKQAAGVLRSGADEVLLEVSGELDTLTRVSMIPIQFGSEGNFVSLSDIATIEKTISDPPASKVVLKGKPAIVLGALVRAETRLDIWAEKVDKILLAFQQDLPPGITLEKVFEQEPYVKERMDSLVFNFVFGSITIFFSILVLSGFRSALIISASLPLCSLMVLTAMQWLGIPIHQMSVAGLIVALGINNAIVVVDEISQKLNKGQSRQQAVAECTRFLAIPLFASTFTTALSFGPIALMPGPSGEFVGAIGSVAIIAVFCMFVLAIIVVPGIAGFLLKPKLSNSSWLADGWSNATLTKGYAWLLRLTFRHPIIGALVSISLPVAGFVATLQLPEQFFPPADRNQFQIELELPPTSSIAETEQIAALITREIEREKEIKQIAWFFGQSAPVFFYNVIPDRKNSPRYGQAIVDCHQDASMLSLLRRLQKQLDEHYPQATVLVRQLEQGPPFSAPIEVRLFGPDTERLIELGEEVRLVMTQTPEIHHTRSELSESLPKITFAVNEQEARLAGLNHVAIATQLNNSLEGLTGGSVLEATEELPVRVRVAGDSRSDVNKLASLDMLSNESANTLTGVNGAYRGIPLSAIAKTQLDSDVSGITRLNARRMNEVQAFITAGVLPSEVLHDLTQRLEASGFELPPGYTQSLGGAEVGTR